MLFARILSNRCSSDAGLGAILRIALKMASVSPGWTAPPADELVQASTRAYTAQADRGLPAKAKSNVSDRRTRAPLVIGDVAIDTAAKWEWLAQ